MCSSRSLLPRSKASFNVARLELDYLEEFGTYTRLHYANRSWTNIEELLHGRAWLACCGAGMSPPVIEFSSSCPIPPT